MLMRPATRDDLRAVVDLYCAYDVAFRGGVDTDDADLTDDGDRPGFDWQARSWWRRPAASSAAQRWSTRTPTW